MKKKVQNNDMLKSMAGKTEFSVLLGLILLIIAMSIVSPFFLQTANIFNVLSQISRYGIISVGMALIIITGGIDLSVGYVVGLSATTAAYLTTVVGLPWYLVLVLILGLGAFIGFINGTLVTRVGLPAFIVTLAMGKILSGCIMLLTQGRPIDFDSPLAVLGSGYIGAVPMCVLIMFITVFLGTVFAQYTQPGRNIYAIGNNPRAAELSGIKVKKMTCFVYVIESMLCAFCGIIVAGNLFSADATLGTGYDIDTIAAVVIGGVSMTGGEGSIWGALIGASIMGVLKNAFVLLSVSSYWQAIVIGIVILLAVTIDRVRANSKKK